jgi:hypothetical protein
MSMNSSAIPESLAPRSYAYPSRIDPMLSPGKRKKGELEITSVASLDAVSKGFLGYDDAVLYFQAFFQGCVSHIIL